jgi:hypothetical protein
MLDRLLRCASPVSLPEETRNTASWSSLRTVGRYPDTVSVLTGDPMAMSVKLTGERQELDGFGCLRR